MDRHIHPGLHTPVERDVDCLYTPTAFEDNSSAGIRSNEPEGNEVGGTGLGVTMLLAEPLPGVLAKACGHCCNQLQDVILLIILREWAALYAEANR